MLNQVRQTLAAIPATDKVTLVIAERDQSVFRGIRSANMHRLQQLGLLARFALRTDPEQPRQTLRVVPVERHATFRL